MRKLLRTRTRRAHESAETLYRSLDITRKNEFTRFLVAHYLAARYYEKIIELKPQKLPPSLRPPSVVPELKEDLRVLGLFPEHFLELQGQYISGDVLGIVYVISGSHLGIRSLIPIWESSSEPCVAQAKNFICCEKFGSYWPQFLRYLRQTKFSIAESERVIQAANDTFKVFRAGFQLAVSPMVRSGVVMPEPGVCES